MPLKPSAGKIRHIKIGADLLSDLLRLDRRYGGRLVLITGKMGMGKTTLLVKFGMNDLAKGAYVVWRGRTVDSFHYFPEWQDKVIVFHHKHDDISVFLSWYDGRREEVTDILDVREYKSVDDLIKKLKKGRVNVVYEPTFYKITKEFVRYLYAKARIRLTDTERKSAQFGTLMWFEFYQRLLERVDSEWYTLLKDELDDIFPANPAGILWHLIYWAQLSIKDFRKSFISLIGTAHNYSDIDSRIVEKIPAKIYLAGSKVPRNSLLKKQAVQALDIGEAKIEWDNKYGEISELQPLKVPPARLITHREWTGEVPDIGYALADITADITALLESKGRDAAYKYLEELRAKGRIGRNEYYYLRGLIKNANILEKEEAEEAEME